MSESAALLVDDERLRANVRKAIRNGKTNVSREAESMGVDRAIPYRIVRSASAGTSLASIAVVAKMLGTTPAALLDGVL